MDALKDHLMHLLALAVVLLETLIWYLTPVVHVNYIRWIRCNLFLVTLLSSLKNSQHQVEKYQMPQTFDLILTHRHLLNKDELSKLVH